MLYQFEKGRMFDVLQRKLFENDEDGNMRDSGQGKWFVDYAAGVPTLDGCKALESTLKKCPGFRNWWRFKHKITGQAGEGFVAIQTLVLNDEGVVRRIDTGQALKMIAESEHGFIAAHDFTNTSTEAE